MYLRDNALIETVLISSSKSIPLPHKLGVFTGSGLSLTCHHNQDHAAITTATHHKERTMHLEVKT